MFDLMVVVGILGVPLAITLACLAIQARWYRRSHGGLEFLSARRILRMGERGVARVLARREVAQVYNPWNGYRGQRDSIIEYALEVRSDAGQVFRALSTLPDPDVVIGRCRRALAHPVVRRGGARDERAYPTIGSVRWRLQGRRAFSGSA